jgi:outer membrane lipopolysaccharide assembly protein LptE/RlpB
MTSRLFLLSLFAALVGLTGCANYRLGTEGKLTFTTLYVEPAQNKTLLPQSRAILSTQIRDAFARDGRITLVNSEAEADATLHVAITDYHRDVASVKESDAGLARKFTLTLGVTCTLHENHSGRDLFRDRKVDVHRDAFTDGGQLQSEYQTLPLLAEAMAKKVTHAVLDVW